MAVNSGMAHLSDTLFTTAIALYTLAMISYAAEYAFGRRGRIALTSRATPAKVLVGAGAGESRRMDSAPGRVTKPISPSRSGRGSAVGDRFGRIAVGLTIIGAVVHASSIVVRGAAVDRVPWGNMYEFASVVGLIAVLAFLASLARAPQIRYLGLFVMLPVILVMFLAGTVLYAKASPLVPALQSYWLAIHVSAAASAEGILMTSAVITVLFLMRQRYDKRVTAQLPVRFPISLGGASAGAGDPRQGCLPHGRVRLPDIHVRGHRRRHLGRGSVGALLGLGSQGDLGIHCVGDLRRLPACPGDCRLEGSVGGVDQPARLQRDDVQLLRGQHRHLRPAFLRRTELTAPRLRPRTQPG